MVAAKAFESGDERFMPYVNAIEELKFMGRSRLTRPNMASEREAPQTASLLTLRLGIYLRYKYMYMKFSFLIALILGTLVGCAALRPAPVELIAKLPILRVGDPSPPNTEYVLFYPAGFAFPVKLKTSGSLFVSGKEVESQVTLAKDLYLYKYWASHDGKTWKNSHELLGVEFGGGFDVTGLLATIKLEAK